MFEFDVENPTLNDAIAEVSILADELEYRAEHIPVFMYDDAGDAADEYERLMAQAGAIRMLLTSVEMEN